MKETLGEYYCYLPFVQSPTRSTSSFFQCRFPLLDLGIVDTFGLAVLAEVFSEYSSLLAHVSRLNFVECRHECMATVLMVLMELQDLHQLVQAPPRFRVPAETGCSTANIEQYMSLN